MNYKETLFFIAKCLTISLEAKNRQALNLHQTLAKAKRKAGKYPVIIAWKKLKKQKGQQRRSADGEPVVYCMDEKTFFALLHGERYNDVG